MFSIILDGLFKQVFKPPQLYTFLKSCPTVYHSRILIMYVVQEQDTELKEQTLDPVESE